MNVFSLLRFVALAAIWGASFLFMRVLSPEVGGVWTAQSRLSIGALALVAWLLWRKVRVNWADWRHFAVSGVLNCALPFSLYGVAGQILPASYSAVLNSTVPLWTTVFAAWLLGEAWTRARLLALALGVLGVVVLVNPSARPDTSALWLMGAGACVVATASYALNLIYLKKWAPHLNLQANAALSQGFGALILLPIALFHGVPESVSVPALWSGLLLGVFCSGLALLLYYRLLDDVGAVMASSVTFFIPVFGILWGAVFLHETLGWNVLVGCVLIVAGAVTLYLNNLKKVAK